MSRSSPSSTVREPNERDTPRTEAARPGGNVGPEADAGDRSAATGRIRPATEEPLQLLMPGDVILLPGGAGHAVGSAPAAVARTSAAISDAWRPAAHGSVSIGTGPVRARILCAEYDHDKAVSTQVLAMLPEVVHLRAAGDADGLAQDTVRLIGRELAAPRAAAGVVLDRLIDVLLIQVLGAWLASGEAPARPGSARCATQSWERPSPGSLRSLPGRGPRPRWRGRPVSHALPSPAASPPRPENRQPRTSRAGGWTSPPARAARHQRRPRRDRRSGRLLPATRSAAPSSVHGRSHQGSFAAPPAPGAAQPPGLPMPCPVKSQVRSSLRRGAAGMRCRA